MSVPVKLVSFAAVVALSFGIAYGAGAAIGPIGEGSPATTPTTTSADHGGHP